MAEVQLTVRQILDLGLWENVCDYKGWNYWILNEGRISEDEEVTFNSTFEKEETKDKHGLSENDQWRIKDIIKQLNGMSAEINPHSSSYIDEAVELLEVYLD